MRYSIITTCKGRLHHLKQTLGLMVAQLNCEVVVVDYDCPDKTATWVSENFPSVKVVRVSNPPDPFNLPDARNRGAAVAVGERLAFIDADIILAPHFLQTVDEILVPGYFCRFSPQAADTTDQLNGTCVLFKSDFISIGGYDDVLVGYAGEDFDLYFRLHRHRHLKSLFLPASLAAAINHSNSVRGRYYESLSGTFLLGAIYRLSMVWTGAALRKPMISRDVRQQVFSGLQTKVREALAGRRDTIQIDVALPSQKFPSHEWDIKASIVVTCRRKKA